MDTAKINPYIRVAMPSVLSVNVEIRQRIIFDYELIYIEDGSFTLTYDGTDYVCRPGDFLLLRPGVPHRFYGINHTLSQPHIHFDITHRKDSPFVPVCFKDFPDLTAAEKDMIRADIFESYPKTPFISFQNKEYVLSLFYDIVSKPASPVLLKKAKLIMIIEQLIADDFPTLLEDTPPQYSVENEIRDYIDAGQGLTLDLDDLSRQFSYNKFYLDRRFKKTYGISIIAYRNQKRMQMAREMLQTENVSRVAEELGYSSVYVFSRAFRLYHGFPPSKIKQR